MLCYECTYQPEDYMNKLATLAAVAAIMTAAVPAIVTAQGTTQTIAAVDVKMLATGLRGSKIIGADVVNENRSMAASASQAQCRVIL